MWDLGRPTALGGPLVGQHRGLLGRVTTVATATLADNRRVAISGSADGTICIWDIAQAVLLHTIEIESNVLSIAVASDGTIIVAASAGLLPICPRGDYSMQA